MPEANRIFGDCPEADQFPRIRRAVEEAANIGEFDWKIRQQYITFNVEALRLQRGYVTLPRFVQMPKAMTLDCNPAFPRSLWFVHHFNGPGDRTQLDCYRSFWDDKGEFCTLRDMTGPSQLIATNLNAGDAALQIRVYGLDLNGNEIYSDDGKPGVPLAMNTPTSVTFSNIRQVYRPLGVGVITLKQVTDDTLLGYYYPDEQTPQYRRVHIPKCCRTVTITYNLAIPQITCLEDWIPIRNRNALIAMMQFIFHLDKHNYDDGEKARAIAARALEEEQDALNLQTPVGPQIQNFSTNTGNDRLYGGWGYGPRVW